MCLLCGNAFLLVPSVGVQGKLTFDLGSHVGWRHTRRRGLQHGGLLESRSRVENLATFPLVANAS